MSENKWEYKGKDIEWIDLDVIHDDPYFKHLEEFNKNLSKICGIPKEYFSEPESKTFKPTQTPSKTSPPSSQD